MDTSICCFWLFVCLCTYPLGCPMVSSHQTSPRIVGFLQLGRRAGRHELQHPKICMSGAKDPSRIPESPRWQNRVWGGWGRERPAVVKTVKLKKELDMMQEEKRLRQKVSTYPRDVDALCEYACFLASVKRDWKSASEHYSKAIKVDATRARRVATQLWSDMFALQIERESAFRIKERWMDLLASLDGYQDGLAPNTDVLDAVLRLGAPVADDPRLQRLLDSTTKDGQVDCFRFADGLRIEPDVKRYKFIRFCEKIVGRAPSAAIMGNDGVENLEAESVIRGSIRRILIGKALARKSTVTPVKQKKAKSVLPDNGTDSYQI